MNNTEFGALGLRELLNLYTYSTPDSLSRDSVEFELERRLQVASDDAFTAGYNDGYADGQDSVYPEDD